MIDSNLQVLILAAGVGKRMKSATIKVLHAAAGRPIIDYVLDLVEEIGAGKPVMVIGHQRDAVRAHCQGRAEFALQEEQLGTGHAVLQAEPLLRRGDGAIGRVLVLSGDVPLTRPDECCGFGGVFSVAEPEVSCRMGLDRLDDQCAARAHCDAATTVSADPKRSCHP